MGPRIVPEQLVGCSESGRKDRINLNILYRVLPHERGCRGICPDLGEPLLEDANRAASSSMTGLTSTLR